jgi:hypothetical protein
MGNIPEFFLFPEPKSVGNNYKEMGEWNWSWDRANCLTHLHFTFFPLPHSLSVETTTTTLYYFNISILLGWEDAICQATSHHSPSIHLCNVPDHSLACKIFSKCTYSIASISIFYSPLVFPLFTFSNNQFPLLLLQNIKSGMDLFTD